MLDIRRMRVLREVAAQGSFSAAAESLSYTQSAISQQIAALEREAGMTLVERGPRGVRLTDAGRALVEHAEAILARLADAEAELEAISGLRAGRLRVAAFPSVGATLVPAAVGRFRAAHPEVELEVRPAEPEDGIAMLRAGEADIALNIEVPLAHDVITEGVNRVPILDDHMYVVLPAGHPLSARRKIKLEDLAEDSWIMGSNTGTCPDARILEQACAGAGFSPDVVFQSDDYPAIQGFVAAGVGVSLIPELALVSVRDDIVVLPLASRPPFRRITAVTLTGAWDSPAKQGMLDVLLDVGEQFALRRGELQLVS